MSEMAHLTDSLIGLSESLTDEESINVNDD